MMLIFCVHFNMIVFFSVGFYSDVHLHDNTALPRLHEQRSDRSDCFPDPYPQTALPDDRLHPTGH